MLFYDFKLQCIVTQFDFSNGSFDDKNLINSLR